MESPLLNFALKGTTLLQVVFSVDADFIISQGLHESLTTAGAASALLEDVSIQRNVIVIPAFETEGSLGLEKGGDIATLAQKGEHSTSALSWTKPIAGHRMGFDRSQCCSL